MFTRKSFLICSFLLVVANPHVFSQEIPKILGNKTISKQHYLPDYSYAGYHFGESRITSLSENTVYAKDHGVIANDGKDDTKALLKLVDSLKSIKEAVVLQLPKGRIILSDFLYVERSNFVLRGHGTGKGGTEIYCPRPMMYFKAPESLAELREYLVSLNKRQKEPENNIDLPFSQYAWSGGMIWTQVPGERVKSYLSKYEPGVTQLATVYHGEMGGHTISVNNTENINIGDVLELQLFNKDGENGSFIRDLYKNDTIKIGSHHWNFPDLPLVRQQVKIVGIKGNKVTLKAPLTIDIKPEYHGRLVAWKHLEEVGLEHFKITFPEASYIAHHVERGFNGIFLTRLFNSWVRDIVIENADSGILTEEIANVTIDKIVTKGKSKAHYTVAMAGVHNVLVKDLKVYNKAVHPISFNTFSTKNVYKDCEVFIDPILDQHSGANHQNLFDNITVHLNPKEDGSYALFEGGGAGYWAPFHGPYTTFWNIQVKLLKLSEAGKPITLNGMKGGPLARLVGIYGDSRFIVEYGPDAYIEKTNVQLKIPSLYDYQLNKRLK